MRTAALYARAVLGIRDDDVVFSAAKLFFAYGLGNALTFPLAVGAHRGPHGRAADAGGRSRASCASAQPTIFGGVPTLFASLLADADVRAHGLSPRLRVSTSAGEALPRTSAKRGARASAPTSSTASARPRCCTSSSRTAPATSATARPASRCPATSSSCARRRRAGRRRRRGLALGARPDGCAGYWNQRERSLAHLPRPVDAHRRSLQARRRGLLHLLRAAPTTCSRSAASGSRRSRSRARSPRTPPCSRPRSSAPTTATGSSSPRRSSSCRRARPPATRSPPSSALRQGPARALQVPALDRVRRRAPEDGDRQDPALQAALRLSRAHEQVGLPPSGVTHDVPASTQAGPSKQHGCPAWPHG